MVRDRVKHSEKLITKTKHRELQIQYKRELRAKDIEKERELRAKEREIAKKEIDTERELRTKDLEKECELRTKEVQISEHKFKSQEALFQAKPNECKATTEAELCARLLDTKYHADYQLLRDKSTNKPEK